MYNKSLDQKYMIKDNIPKKRKQKIKDYMENIQTNKYTYL